ncbi:MAG: AMP-binding protein [Hyphomicrobiaceae bacterium]
MLVVVAAAVAVLLATIYAAWRRYLWASEQDPAELPDSCAYSLTDRFSHDVFVNVPHQKNARWLTEIFSRSAARYPSHVALQVPHTGESLTYSELDTAAERIANALSHYVNGPDQVVAVAMSQDNWQIVASHLAILKAGGTMMFLDTTLPEALIAHMLNDARPVVVMTNGQPQFRDLPTLDVLNLPEPVAPRSPPNWLDDPTERLAAIFYTSGTTGLPKGVECPHAGYVNLALTYADYFDFLPGMDATTLTSSLGYDGSMSEMYGAWVSGCTVVLITKDQMRSGPDLVPILRDAEVTVLFCPPVLLTTLTSTPEIDLPYPICRYIVPAGEAFPKALVEPWTRARRQVINTYGPTEASTDTSRQSLKPGEAITIGSPFPNVTYAILDDDGLTPLPHGEEGELCIGGVHLAGGYRNLPEQTASKFFVHPKFGRLYRTGDKCRIDPTSYRVDFLGRIDAQLKVRGHRVEAQAVEDILQSRFEEIEAAVLDYQNESLIAFVSAPTIASGPIDVAMPAPANWADSVTTVLAKQLPEFSVPSRIFVVEKFSMKPVSGKIDRNRLPDLASLSLNLEPALESANSLIAQAGDQMVIDADSSDRAEEANSEIPAEAQEALVICRSVFDSPIEWDDDFADFGAHSIMIARLAQRLQQAGWRIPVRALFTDCNTARKIACRPRDAEPIGGSVSIPVPQGAPIHCRDEDAAKVISITQFTILQLLFSLAIYFPGFLAFLSIFAFLEVGTFFATASIWAFIAVGFGLYVVGLSVPFAFLFWGMAIKLLLGGHVYKNSIRPGIYPKWSWMHLRIWCVGRVQNMVLMPIGGLYRSAPLMAFALRQLGAKVGSNLQCARDVSFSGPLDLITVEDDVAIQTGAYIHTARWQGQDLHVGPIHLASDCKIGMRAGVASDVKVGRETWIAPFTPVVADVGSNELWEGAPGRATGRYTKLRRTQAACQYTLPIWLLETLNVLMQIMLVFLLSILPTAIILWSVRQFIPMGETDLAGASFTTSGAITETVQSSTSETGGIRRDYFVTAPLYVIFGHLAGYAFITMWLTIVITSILDCLFIRMTATSPGIYGSRGLRAALLMYRMSLLNGIQVFWTWTITGQYLRALSGLRLPHVGASECDIMFNLVPEVASADTKVFWSNGSFTNVLDYGAEHIALRQIDMPPNFFSGNNCVIENGALPDNFLVGVSTPCSDVGYRRQMRSRPSAPITVAGNPPLEIASAAFEDENQSHRLPGFGLFLGRVLLNDIFSIGFLRAAEALLFTLLYISLARQQIDAVVAAILALILVEIGLVGLTVAVKQVLVGNRWGTNHTAPFWSWRHFTYFFAQDCFFIWCRGPLGFLAGTILANPILRWLGCQVGSRTIVIEPMQCSDWNAVRFGRDCIVGGFLQLHTFENMTLKVKATHFGDGTTVAFGATVLSGVVTDRSTTLEPLSMALKEMHLPTGVYEGSPVEEVRK